MKHDIIHKKTIKAEAFEKNEQYIEAIDEYYDIYLSNPSNRDIVFKLGSLYSKLNKFVEAEKWFILATDLIRDYISFFNLGSFYYKHQHFKKAIITLERSRAYNENYIQTKIIMGLSFSRLNNQKAAENNFISVIKDDANNRVALTALGILYYNSNRNNEALEIINRLCQIINNEDECKELNRLKQNLTLRVLGRNSPSLREKADGYRIYDDFAKSIDNENYNDKFGSIEDKITKLKKIDNPTSRESIALSLCYLLNGESQLALDELINIKKKNS